MPQQLAHATSNGASVRAGDLMASGTDLRFRARQRREPDRADVERPRPAAPERRQRAHLPRGRRRGRPARQAARRGPRPHRRGVDGLALAAPRGAAPPFEPRLLALRTGGRWRLPRVLVRRGVWVANAEVAVPAFEQRLGTRPWLLRQLWFAEDEERERIETVYELALLDEEWEPPSHGRWLGRADLDRLHDDAQRQLLAAYLDARERAEVPHERPPWSLPGWRDDVRAWLEDELPRLGRRLAGLEQVKQWSISSVLRVRTDGPDLYFKVSAPLPLFVAEGTVTASLAERFPAHVPAPLAVEPERGWMLFDAFDLAGWDAPPDLRCELFRRFAGLQLARRPLTDELLADGCLDRRLDVLERQLDPLLGSRRLRQAHGRGDPRPADAHAEVPGDLPPARGAGPAADARARRPARRQRRAPRRRARVLRLDGRVRRAPVHRPPLAPVGARRVGARGAARCLPRAVAGGGARGDAARGGGARRRRDAAAPRRLVPDDRRRPRARVEAELDATHAFLREALARIREL